MFTTSYILSLFSIYSPLVLYPIPYINPNWISQKRFMTLCEFRIFLLFTSFFSYNYFQDDSFFSTSWIAMIFGTLLLLVGQFLNASVYSTLGIKGVYYGIQYGTVVPKKLSTETFPFCLQHPLYIGGCLSYLGILLLTFWKERGMDSSILFLWYNAEMIQFSLILMENYFDCIYG